MKAASVQYVVQGNADQTEGRGGFVDRQFFKSLEDAYKCVMSGKWGVMGTKGDGRIVERKWLLIDGIEWHAKDTPLWGYRKDWAGKFGYGWVDNRDAPTDDPEFDEYLRLRKKFGIVE